MAFISRPLSFREALLLGVAMGSPLSATAQVYKDPDASVEKRAADLVSRMTLEEKARQMQNAAPAIPRLDLPAYDWWNEGLHGLARAGEATVFPQAIGMAATWDRELLKAEGRVIGTEARARYNQAQREGNVDRYFGLTIWSPNINIFRDPRWGRGQETLGEDPYLTGTLGTAFVEGLQGDDPRYFLTVATPKHLAVHSGPEPLRHGFNVDVAPQDLAETYLPAFRRTITEGNAYSLMCAYNAVNGSPACGSTMLLKDYVRDAWGFKGFITSDCGAIDDFVAGHKTQKNWEEAAAVSINAGTDTGCNFRDEYLAIPNAVRRGLLAERDVDTAVRRLMTACIRLGMLDPAARVPYAAIPYAENHSAAHRAVALRAARESIVLLKNDRVLPVAATAKRVLVVGPAAASREALNGNYKGTAVGQVLPVDGIAAALGNNRVTFAQGAPFVEQVAVTVPRTIFGAQGVTARFWNGAGFAGPVIATRTEREIDNDWNGIAPAPGVDQTAFSAEYAGTLTVPANGEYVFEIGDRRCDWSEDQQTYVLSIEGQPDVRATSKCFTGVPLSTPPIRMEGGKPRSFRLAFTHHSPRLGAGLTLTWKPQPDALLQEAVKAAGDADMIVAMVGLTAGLEGEEMKVKAPGFNGGDRTTIALPAVQQRLLDALVATGRPVAIVGVSGSALTYGSAGAKAKAVLQAWYGGEAAGQAIGEVLAGTVNPSGRLPVTFYASVDQLPPFGDYDMKNRTYRYFNGRPEYPFGHGLSYTRFDYSALGVQSTIHVGQPVSVAATIRNTGQMAGDEVAQLYISPVGRLDLPRRSLKGYQRVRLAPGEIRQVQFSLSPRDLAFADGKGVMRVTPGRYRLWVGGGQEGKDVPGVVAEIRVAGSRVLPK
ncbi:glycoside hydrolase family 3 C-terminal domain-containing protein [Sphingomonas sp. BK235]|uniref:glycoside hydrolase family 3 C-terminal domain-containing protein n=1 Tax=Sphingomonas sp. BK235 TaxID=2512131 RepID=UPI001051E8E5|nr:glycoside hydrolase family 3 C-terminal domain-containing protein [Sphingomonas sp. BK235]TCP33236.1 beta-glucosidase [Sphingomonas sp. BK235]